MSDADKAARVALADILPRIAADGPRSAEAFRHGSLVVKVYAPRGHDPQTPHKQDEVYVVMSGSGRFVADGTSRGFGPGDMLFVAAGVTHRFEDFSDDLALWVVFWGPEGGEVRPD